MPHNYSAALKARLKAPNATLAIGARITRKDGWEIGLTTHMRSQTVNGLLLRSQPGLISSALVSKDSLSVDNAELRGFVQSDAIRDSDILGGAFDAARAEFFVYDYTAPGIGTGFLGRGSIGNVQLSDDRTWMFEFRSLEQLLAQEIGQVSSVTCRYKRLGQDGCAANVNGNDALGRQIRQAGTVAALPVAGSRSLPASGTAASAPEGFFNGGIVTWTSGENQNWTAQVRSFTGGVFTFWQLPPLPLAAGDTFIAEEGCDRRIETCSTVFNAAWSMEAEPFLPGPENLYRITD